MSNSLNSAAEDDDARASDGEQPTGNLRSLARPVANGALGGLVGTLAMTAYRLPLFEGLPPTAEFWAQYVGDGDPSSYPLQALVLHFGYGAAGGSVLGLALARTGDDPGERDDRITLLAGVAYALVLSALGNRVLLERILDVDLTAPERLVFHVGHVVYGLALGTWLGTAGAIGRSEPDA